MHRERECVEACRDKSYVGFSLFLFFIFLLAAKISWNFRDSRELTEMSREGLACGPKVGSFELARQAQPSSCKMHVGGKHQLMRMCLG